MKTLQRPLSSLVLVAALVAAGCGGGGSSPSMVATPTPAPVPGPVSPTGESFTGWSKSGVFARAETETPVEMDSLVFNFDGDENPDAYVELLPSS